MLCHLSRLEFLGDLPLVAEPKNRIHAIFTGTKWVMSFGWDTVILFGRTFGRTCCEIPVRSRSWQGEVVDQVLSMSMYSIIIHVRRNFEETIWLLTCLSHDSRGILYADSHSKKVMLTLLNCDVSCSTCNYDSLKKTQMCILHHLDQNRGQSNCTSYIYNVFILTI